MGVNVVTSARSVPGSAASLIPAGAALLHPQEAVFEAMLRGWSVQQGARLLAPGTIAQRVGVVRRFFRFVGAYPWEWQPVDVEEFTVWLRSHGARAHSTLRSYQNSIALFCDYLVDPRYAWGDECVRRFGTHPIQICHEWNTARHVSEFEADPRVRPFTRSELQVFFDYSDDQVQRARSLGRKGWLAAFRDAALFKTIYAFGLRRNEVAMLDITDFHRNAAAPQFGAYGVCTVRFGKALKGSTPRRRNVLAVMPWSVEVLSEYVEIARSGYGVGQRSLLWPTERGGRVSGHYIGQRFASYREASGLPEELHPHCLRHSYVTHLIEDGWDPYFVQQQVGHAWSSTTSLYTGVSNDYKNTMLRSALERGLAGQ